MSSNSLSTEAMATMGTAADASTLTSNIGIDLNTALELLSHRSLVSHQSKDNKNPNISQNPKSDNISNEAISKSGFGCCSVANFNPENVSLSSIQSTSQMDGQLIDIGTLIEDQDDATKQYEAINDRKDQEVLDKQKDQHEAQQRVLKRQEELAITIQSMTIKEVISTIFHTQEERVRSYRFFDE
jgi:hypothetical protein